MIDDLTLSRMSYRVIKNRFLSLGRQSAVMVEDSLDDQKVLVVLVALPGRERDHDHT